MWHLLLKVGDVEKTLRCVTWEKLHERMIEVGAPMLNKQMRSTFLMLAADATPEHSWSCTGENFQFKIRKIATSDPIPRDLDVADEIDHGSRDHATLGASSSFRWWNCSGCFNRAALLGCTSSTSIYAMEGTAAHELCHLCLLQGNDAIEFIERKITIEGHDFYVNDEMASAVQVYLDVCRSLQGPDVECLTEKKFNLKKLNPPGPMFGTADFVAINRATGKITIVDFKYGKGVVVQIERNPQLMYYALGVLCSLPSEVVVKEIETIVVQPRVSAKPKSATYQPIELFEWSVELMDRAKKAMDPNAGCNAGPWCRSTFCPASGRCATEAESAFNAAQIEFTAEVLHGEIIPPNKLPELRILTPQQLGAIKHNFEVLKGFMSSVDEALTQAIENGAEDTGWKLVSGEGHRAWLDPDQDNVAKSLAKQLGFSAEETHVTTVVSPAQAEKIAVGKLRSMGMKRKDAEPMVKQMLNKLTVRPPTKPSLVSVTNERPALPARGSEFEYEQLPANLSV